MYCTPVHSCVSERGGWRTFTVSPFLRFTMTLAESDGSRKMAARSIAISAVAAAGTATAGEGRRIKNTPAAITTSAPMTIAPRNATLFFFLGTAAGVGCGAGLSIFGAILATGGAASTGCGGGTRAGCAAAGLAAKNEVTSPETGATGAAWTGGDCGRGGSATTAGERGAAGAAPSTRGASGGGAAAVAIPSGAG